MTKSGTLPILAIGLPKPQKIINFNYLNCLYKNPCLPPLTPGSGDELLSLRGCPGTMANNSQIEKITESGVPFRALSPGKANAPTSYPQYHGKNYLLPGRGGGVHIYRILW
jgi:hypothetical protein